MVHSTSGTVHLAAAIAAMLFGLCVLLVPKGTRLHKRLGYGYVISMLVLNGTALLIFRLFRGFGPFHIAAGVSLASIVAGFLPVFLRRPRHGWWRLHFEFMTWSYIGLVAAAASELAVRLPRTPFWPGVFISSAVVFAVGAIMISRARTRFANFLPGQSLRKPVRP